MADDETDTSAQDRVGSVLDDKWTLEALIGMGGMAAVYAARHRNGARSAVKVLHSDLARNPDVRQRFLREGYAANKVEHPGVVKVLDDDVVATGPDEGAAYLVMELLEGISLEERIKRGPPMGERELLLVLREIASVLEVAHAAGVVHRDLKPENLFLLRTEAGAEPKVKVLDFGLARLREGRRTIAGLAIGTPSYMPPEQAAGRVVEMDHRADIFALGATAFRVLAGRTVHPASSPMEIVLRMAKEPAPKIRSVAPTISEATASVIDRALAFAKEDRFPDAAAMRVAIEGALQSITGGAELDREIELSLSEAQVEAILPASDPPPRPQEPVDPPDPALQSILQKLDLAPRPLWKRWRIFVAAALAWGAIGVAVSLEEEPNKPQDLEARVPSAHPSASAPSSSSGSSRPARAPAPPPHSAKPR